jgi:hypothetical protein
MICNKTIGIGMVPTNFWGPNGPGAAPGGLALKP